MAQRADIQQKPRLAGENICTKLKCDLGQVDVIFYNYNKDVLENEIKAAYSERITAQTDRSTAENTSGSKYCCFTRIDLTYEEYRQLDICLASVFDQGTDEVLAKVASLEQRDKEVVAAFNAAHLAVMDLKKKAGELKDAACKLKFAIPDPCNSEQLKALREHIVDDPNTTDPEQDFETIAASLISDAEEVCSKANQAFEFTVKVTGIHAYVRVDSLKPLATALVNAADAFKADINANLKTYGDEWKKVWDEYVLSRRTISTSECVTRVTTWRQNALCNTKEFVCTPDCEPVDTAEDRLEVICKEVEGCFPTNCNEERGHHKPAKWNKPPGAVN